MKGIAVLLLSVTALALASFAWLRASDEPGGQRERAARQKPAAGTGSSSAPIDLPEGALKPIIGDPRPDEVRFCDEEMWRGVAPMLKEVRGHDAVVDEAAWRSHGGSAQGGIASWISKCRLAGESVTLVGDASGDRLGYYDSGVGYRAEAPERP